MSFREVHTNPLGNLLGTADSDSMVWVGPKILYSRELPGDAHTSGPQPL